MKRLDEISINEYGIPGVVLMENAGSAVVREIEKLNVAERYAKVVCGTGNNGGDGFVIARHLYNKGWRVKVLVCGEEERIKGDALVNLQIAKRMGIPICFAEGNPASLPEDFVCDSPLVVDALLGTGFKGKLRGLYKEAVDRINSSNGCVVAVDIPSGLDADTGFAGEACVRADITVTFQLPKLGLLINDGPEACGSLAVKDISIPEAAVCNAGLHLNLLEKDMIETMLPKRKRNTHKGSFGSVLIAACSKGMEGSGIMASKAALRSGAGIVRLALPESLQKSVSAGVLEIMTKGLEDGGSGIIVEACIPQLLEAAGKSSALLIGPGLTDSEDIRAIMHKVVESCTIPVIIDADGLNAIAADPGILKKRRSEIVITPHPGELARLCGCSSSDIQQDRLGYAGRFAGEFNVIVVLKGFRTIIAFPDGTAYINPTGNPGMATAGSGDVLAGMIAGFAAQKMKLSDAVLCGVYLHGAAGDRGAEEIGEYGLTAGDIIENIPHTIKTYNKS